MTAAYCTPNRTPHRTPRRTTRITFRTTFRKTALAVAAMIVTGTATLQQAEAASCTWNPATGNWGSAGNWSCGIVPTGPGSDSATISVGKTVTVDTGQSIFGLTNAGSINLDAFTFTLQGSGSTTNTGTINVGGPSTAALQISGGHNVTNTGGVINIGNGSVANQFGSSITGGTINTTGTGALVAFNSGSNFLNGVALNGLLDMSGLGIERITGGLVLNGTVNIGNNSVLAPQGDQTFSGTGNIVFTDNSGSNRLNVEAGNLTLGSGLTVRGNTGYIGQQSFVGGAATLTNNGTISADVAGGTITLAVNGTVTNNGTLSAQNGGTLLLNNSISGGVGSQIVAGAGSTVIQNGVTLNGTITNAGSGSFHASNSGSNIFSSVNFSGVLDLATAVGVERVLGGLVLNGTVNIGNNSVLAPQGDQTISGTGNIVFTDTSGSNRLNVEAGNLTLGSGITVRGNTGYIGQQSFAGGAATLTNNGTITADVAGGTITLAVGGAVTNNGLLSAQNGGTLLLNNSINGGVGSQIVAGAGSTVIQNGVTLNGTITNAGTGSFRASNSGSNIFNGVSFSGVLDLATAVGVERVLGGLVLNGTVNIGNNSVLAPQGDQTISGAGKIVFTDASGSNRLNVEAGNLTLGSGVTVRGNTGYIGQQSFVGGAATLTNNGTVSADVSGGTITLAVNGLITNNGTLSALNGGTLLLNSNVQGNAGSQILSGSGSTVLQNGVTLTGAINTAGSGTFRSSNSGNNFLNGVTYAGTLDLATVIGIERVVNGLTLNGATINLGNNSVLAPQGDQTIGGTGAIVFTDSAGSNRLNVEGGNLILGSGITVRGGAGFIGQQAFVGGAATLTNQGVISADVAGTAINVGVNGLVTNQGTMRAQNGGTLVLNAGGGYDNSAGVMLADTGSVVLFNNAIVTGGALNSNGSGAFNANNSGGNFLNGVTLNGVLDMSAATGIERISAGGMTLNGTIKIGNNSVFAPQGDQTISGTGSIMFADASGSNRLNVEAGNLVFGSGVTVRGQTGIIGQQAFAGGAATLTNNGTINADAGGTITVAVNGAVINNGTMRAQNGTLSISNGLTGTGTLQVDSTGTINLANAANTQGRLVMGALGATLNIGTQNLTITNDYTSVVAGTGNAFDRRAGVNGAGLIVAGGDAAQALTGAGVTNGNTANATLTLGNMRVGATTYNYQVANTGSTGPVLRGAIQTAVNGANLTDARLSGAGVTASNYKTGPAGSNSGNLGVTFTAANAGALAPLSGQVLNLTSNFSNIADQRLNIVISGGAAAFNAAVGSATSPVTVANQRIGGTNTAALAITNTAAAGAFSEDLNAAIGSTSGAATASGAVLGRLAGTGNTGSGAITVGVDTTVAGARTGGVTLAYQTAGAVNGVSNGLGTASVGTQVVTVNGNVYQAASGAVQTAALNFGTVQVGQLVSQALVIRNAATGAAGFVEDLNASFGASTGTSASIISGAGTLAGILAGSNSTAANGSMTVTVNTAAAGAVSGGIAVNYTTAGAVNGASNGLGTAAAGSQNYGVAGTIQAQANVINQASPLVNNPAIDFGARRVGDASPSAFVSVTNQATVSPQAALNASIASNGAPVTASGSFSLLNPAGTSANQLSVGLSTANAGNFTGANAGSATLSLVSDASNVGNCGANCQVTLASQQVSVSGKVYTAAVAQVNTASVDFGIVHTGDVVALRSVSVSNAAPSTALNDVLRGTFGSATGPFTATGTLAGVAAQGSDATSFQAGLTTAASGLFTGSATAAFASHNADMSDLPLSSSLITLKGQVNNYAQAALAKTSGTAALSHVGNTYTLDFGTLTLGSASLTDALQVLNGASGLADLLAGSFDVSGVGSEFSLSGFGPFSGLGAGAAQSGLLVSFASGTLGTFDDAIVLHAFGSNASGYNAALFDTTLVLHGSVVGINAVPEPGTNLMIFIGLLGLVGVGRARRAKAMADAA